MRALPSSDSRMRRIALVGLVLVVPARAQPGTPPQARTASVELPVVVHWCAQHCTTWTLDKGAPFDKPHYGSQALGSIVIVERFTPASVIMRRTDYRPYPGVAVLTGELSADGNSIVNGTIKWTYHPCCGLSTGKYQAAWGTALDTVPGSDAERSRRTTATRSAPISPPKQPNQPNAASANVARANPGEPIPCNDRGHPPATSERAVDIGKQAALARNDSVAFGCFLFAAQQGNASAQVDVAYAYEKGVATAADPAEARRWYLAAAQQGNTFAQFTLTQFYKNGTGGPADSAEADRWTATMWNDRNRHSKICGLKPMKETIALVEWDSVGDGAGQVLGALAAVVTGVNPQMANARPALTSAQGSDVLQQYGRFHIDLGTASGDFICQTIFTRGPFKDCGDNDPKHEGMAICIVQNGAEKPLNAKEAEAAFAGFPQFREMFRARPLADGRYQITLVPTSLQLASVYSRTTREPIN
jgi:hypothetical protein